MPQAFTLVRIAPNGNETVVATVPITDIEYQQRRGEALLQGRALRQANRRYVVYGPSDSPTLDLDDRVWDSAVDL